MTSLTKSKEYLSLSLSLFQPPPPMYSPITSPDETTDAEQAPPPPTVQGCCSPHESYLSPAVAADPIVGIDQLLSEVAATHVTTHVVFHDPPASPEPPHTEHGCSSALQESAEVVLNIATTSDRPLTIVVVEDDDTHHHHPHHNLSRPMM